MCLLIVGFMRDAINRHTSKTKIKIIIKNTERAHHYARASDRKKNILFVDFLKVSIIFSYKSKKQIPCTHSVPIVLLLTSVCITYITHDMFYTMNFRALYFSAELSNVSLSRTPV